MIKLSAEAHDALHELIPHHMHRAIIDYFEHGLEPGSFLRAVLENDLYRAAGSADHINANRLKDYVLFLYNYVPGRASGMWGSPEAVHNFLKEAYEQRKTAV